MPVLIGMLLVSVPLYAYLSWLVLWFVCVFAAWSALVIRGVLRPPGSWLRFLLVLLVVAVLVISYGTVFGLLPGTSMVILLSYLKLFEMKSKRDIVVIILLGFFLASSSFFHSQALWIAIYIFVLTIYLVSLLVLVADRMDSIGWRERMKYSTRMVLQSLPLMLILFLLFPRIPGPLWGLPKDALTATTGLSEEMTPGDINKLVASYRVAFRVKFDTRPPSNRDLYWRGLVLSDYDGKTWRRNDAPSWTSAETDANGSSENEIRYTLTLEPHQHNWLYALEQISSHDRKFIVTRELQLLSKQRINNVISYEMGASLYAVNHGLYAPERRKNLELPAGLNPETLALGWRMRKDSRGDERAIVAAALHYFSDEKFYYTLSPPLLGDNAMDDFLFESRRGFCEHYASAFVYLVRAAGVPARVVLGYQGGEINPLDGYMIVRQSDAHAWAEVWIDNHWMRVDPTSAVAPDRIEHGIQNAGLEAQLLPHVLMVDSDTLKRARFMLDSFQNGWNRWVIGFDENRQLEMLRKFGIENIHKSELALWLVALMSVAGLLVAWWVIRDRRFNSKDRVRTYYDKFRKKLVRSGIAVRPQDTPQELVSRIRRSIPSAAIEADAIIASYQAMIYGQARSRKTENEFIQAIRRFRA